MINYVLEFPAIGLFSLASATCASQPITASTLTGSRERYKWVKEYDSYRFESARWSLIKNHFCKIDTWLEGVCEPQNPTYWAGAAVSGCSTVRISIRKVSATNRVTSATARRKAYSRALLDNTAGVLRNLRELSKTSYPAQSSVTGSREEIYCTKDTRRRILGLSQADEDGQEAGDD
jgi:hypothetical protein